MADRFHVSKRSVWSWARTVPPLIPRDLVALPLRDGSMDIPNYL